VQGRLKLPERPGIGWTPRLTKDRNPETGNRRP
jgi:hypothetical protein